MIDCITSHLNLNILNLQTLQPNIIVFYNTNPTYVFTYV